MRPQLCGAYSYKIPRRRKSFRALGETFNYLHTLDRDPEIYNKEGKESLDQTQVRCGKYSGAVSNSLIMDGSSGLRTHYDWGALDAGMWALPVPDLT